MMPLTHSSVPAGSARSGPATLLKGASVPALKGVAAGSPDEFSLSGPGIVPVTGKAANTASGSDAKTSKGPAPEDDSLKDEISADPMPLLALLLPETALSETNPAASTQGVQLSALPSVSALPVGLMNQRISPTNQQNTLLLSGTLPAKFELNLSPENLSAGMQLPSVQAGSAVIQSNTEGSEVLPITTPSQPTGTEIVQGMAFASANNLLQHDTKIPPSPPLSLPRDEQAAAETLSKALGDRLQMQLDRGIQRATIRLDPPSLGKMDISLHYQEGKLQVHIQAMQPEVLRALQQTAPELRYALSTNNQVQVNVQLSQQGGERQTHQSYQSQDSEIIAGQPEPEVEEKMIRFRDNSVITRV